MKSYWYVIQVFSGQENKVKKSLDENRETKGMTEFITDVLVPSENVAEEKKGEQKISEKRLWPGYALVKMNMTDEAWLYVKETNGVIDFLGGGNPIPLSDEETNEILRDLQERKGEVVHKHKLSVGDQVKIIDGVFVNFTGPILEVNHEKGILSEI